MPTSPNLFFSVIAYSWDVSRLWSDTHNQTYLEKVVLPFVKMSLETYLKTLPSMTAVETAATQTAVVELTKKNMLNSFTYLRKLYRSSASQCVVNSSVSDWTSFITVFHLVFHFCPLSLTHAQTS